MIIQAQAFGMRQYSSIENVQNLFSAEGTTMCSDHWEINTDTGFAH